MAGIFGSEHDDLLATIQAGNDAENRKAIDQIEAENADPLDRDLREIYATYIDDTNSEVRSPRTKAMYLAAFENFAVFCAADHFPMRPLPAMPATVAWYLHNLIGRASYSTIKIVIAAISQAHRLKGYADPCNDLVMGILRKVLEMDKAERAARPIKKKAKAKINRQSTNGVAADGVH